MRKYRSYNEEIKDYIYFYKGKYYLDDSCENTYFYASVCPEFNWDTAQQSMGISTRMIKELFEGDRIKAKTNISPVTHVEGVIFYDDGEYCIEQEDEHFPVCSFHIIDQESISLVLR